MKRLLQLFRLLLLSLFSGLLIPEFPQFRGILAECLLKLFNGALKRIDVWGLRLLSYRSTLGLFLELGFLRQRVIAPNVPLLLKFLGSSAAIHRGV
jgi:hypothetical protein